MQRGFYFVDPALLPAAGVKVMPKSGAAPSLEARKERLTKWHLGEQQRILARTGLATICGSVGPDAAASTPRGAPASARGLTLRMDAHAAGAQLPSAQGSLSSTGRVRDPRLLKVAAEKTVPGLDLMIDGFRRRLQRVGLRSLVELERLFAAMDVDGSCTLSRSEMSEGLIKQQLLSSPAECHLIFDYFDEDQSGSIDYREFLDAVRGQLPDVRRAVVQEAFAQLDVNGDGVISVEDLKQVYRCYAHPDVRNGTRTESDVFQEVLDGFDTIRSDGKVTLAEFERFYENTSAMTSSDELFVQTVRSTWHLPGATGGNCLRLRITRGVKLGWTGHLGRSQQAANPQWQKDLRGPFDGLGQTLQQSVEIRPDLPFNQHDPRFKEAAMRRLREMGFDDVTEIEVLDRV